MAFWTRISSLVTGGTALLAAVVLSLGGLSMHWSNTLRDRLVFVDSHALASVSLLAGIRSDLDDARLSLVRALIETDSAKIADHAKAFDTSMGKVTAGIDKYAELATDPQEKRMSGEMGDAIKVWSGKAAPVWQYLLAGQHDQGLAEYKNGVRTAAIASGEAVLRQVEINQRLARAAADAGVADAGLASTQNLILSGAGLMLALGVLLLFRSRVTGPLGSLNASMQDMAAGNLSVVVPGADKGDELGEIARSLDGIKGSVIRRAEADAAVRMKVQSEVTTAMERALGELKAGNLTFRIQQPFTSEYDGLRQDFNATLAALAEQFAVVADSSQAVRTGASEIAAAAQDLAQRTEAQAAGLSHTAISMRDLTDSIGSAGNDVRAAAGTARETQEEAATSGKLMEAAVSAMHSIATSSGQMRSIVEMIDGISFQTNLLALNAGVEAARAGDAGRGFAVVASEVRSLAERSAQAAREIGTLITNSGREVNQGVAVVGQTQESLARIVTKASHVAELMADLATATGGQAEALGRINETIHDLDRATQQNAALVEESTAASHSLSSEAENLGRVVQRFRLDSGNSWRAPVAAPAAPAPMVHSAPQPAPAPAPRPAPVAAAPVAPRPTPAPASRSGGGTVGNAALAEDDWSEF